jgi:tRNA-specific 2-thiouridylase
MRIAVLMSGGVDSTCAATLLRRAGHDVTGITSLMSTSGPSPGDDDIYFARRACHRLGIGHVVVDMTRQFERKVVGPFVEAYASGLTPNPCALCNREVKLGNLVGLALRSGFDRVATGHYARLARFENRPVLGEPRDRTKSQTYFMSLVRPVVLERLVLPMAEVTKEEARHMVRQLGLPAREVESQDLCFVASREYAGLLRERKPDPGTGEIVDAAGKVLGSHRGHWEYTIGQRLGVKGRRLHVLEKDGTNNRVVVGPRQEAYRKRVTARRLNPFISIDRMETAGLKVKIRYASGAVGAEAAEVGDEYITVLTREPCFAPAPGQVLTCWIGDHVVCGGVIAGDA